MPGPKPGGSGAAMRPGGGFNSAPGGMSEHMDDAALQSAMTQKAGSQQAGQVSPQQMAQAAAGKTQQQSPPREVGTIGEELQRAGADLLKGVKDLFSFSAWFGINSDALSPEDKQRMKTIHQNFQKLDQEQQAYARQKFQEEQQRKKMQEEEAQQRKQQEEAASTQMVMPSGPTRGAKGQGGSKKQQATQRLDDKRKKLGGPGDVN